MKTECLPYKWWLDQIKAERPMALIRYGDGELNGMFWTGRKKGGGRTRNGDGHSLRVKEMREQLLKTVTQPGYAKNYYRSVWMDENCRPVERLAREYLVGMMPKDITLYNALAIHFKNIVGENYSYFQAMRNLKMPIVVIGPKHLRKLPQAGVFEYQGFAEVPYQSAFFDCERIIDEALAFEPPVFYSIHAGPPAPVFAWRLWKERGDSCPIWDLGSVLDGYVGVKTRKFWKKFATKEIMRKNLRGK